MRSPHQTGLRHTASMLLYGIFFSLKCGVYSLPIATCRPTTETRFRKNTVTCDRLCTRVKHIESVARFVIRCVERCQSGIKTLLPAYPIWQYRLLRAPCVPAPALLPVTATRSFLDCHGHASCCWHRRYGACYCGAAPCIGRRPSGAIAGQGRVKTC